MHTRRFGAFLIGAWLIGSVLMWFVQSQSLMTLERILATPPPQVARELDDMGPDVSRQLLRHQAMQLNRRITETWEIIQLGLGAALLVTSALTPHRSKVTIAGAGLMMILAAVMAFYLTPLISGLGRAVDFLPPTAALRERAALGSHEVWHNTLEILKTMLAMVVAVRLLFDFYEFRDRVMASAGKPKVRRRRRRTHRDTPAANPDTEPAEDSSATG